MNAAKAERPLSGPSGNGPEATPDLSVENDPKATSAAPCDILGEGKSQGRSDHAVCKAPARRICLGQHGCAAGACGADVASLKQSIETSFEADYPKLDALYKDLHAHPELAFEEVKTAARLAAEMRALGFEVTEKVGKTGLVAIYKNGDGPTIMVRTELDALPMEEKTGLPYASQVKINWNGRETFVAHSCGHDIHMANWVGTAKTPVGLKDQWRGPLQFIAGA